MKKIKTLIIILALLILFLIFALDNDITITEYDVSSNNKITDDIKIVLISDLHSTMYGDNQEILIDKIKKLEPDVIMCAGDIIDDNEKKEGAIIFLNRVVDIAPTYYVSGNHEFWSNEIDAYKKIVSDSGVIVLNNEITSLKIKNSIIYIYGVDDEEVAFYDTNVEYYEEIFESIWEDNTKNEYRILLSHRPEIIDIYEKYTYDLILSGHAHGGQIRIPYILNGLYSPNQGFFPKYAGGVYDINESKLVVSRGLSINKRLPRVFNPPEIVVINIGK